jgi:hypothetical protein
LCAGESLSSGVVAVGLVGSRVSLVVVWRKKSAARPGVAWTTSSQGRSARTRPMARERD